MSMDSFFHAPSSVTLWATRRTLRKNINICLVYKQFNWIWIQRKLNVVYLTSIDCSEGNEHRHGHPFLWSDRSWQNKRSQEFFNISDNSRKRLVVQIYKNELSGRRRAGTIADLRAPRVQDEQLRTIILDVLTSYLAQFSEYNHNLFGRLGPLLSELIKVRVEEESRETHKKYKIVSQVYIGAVLEDGIDAATQCLWTPCCDKFATASYGTKTLFAVGIVFAVQL